MTATVNECGASPLHEVAPANDHQIQDACDLLYSNPLNRPALYRILRACEMQDRRLNELEDWIQQQPEFTKATQPPFYLIQWLVDASALLELELDAEGNTISPEQKAGLSQDEQDDLIEDYAYRITLIGQAVLAEFDPAIRVRALLEEVPERADTYLELLDFLRQRHSYSEVDDLLRGRDILMFGRAADDRPIQPSVFIDKLAAVGGIAWTNGWKITEEGEELLKTIQASK